MDDDSQGRLSLPEPTAPEAEGVLEGQVVHVTFENPESGFRVLKVRQEGGGSAEPVVVVGVFPAAPEGTRVRATGRFVVDKRFGRQFKAETLLPLAPATLEGIRRYLCSGLVPGIGPKFAQRIVETFGEQTLEVLDRDPGRLREVAGMGKQRIAAVAEAWGVHRDVRDIMVFLQSHGASPALAARIYRCFGREAVHVVSKSPYRLALEVWGIGFKTADVIARSVGVEADSPERAQAGVLHTLHEAAGSGDVYREREALVERTSELLGADPAVVDAGIDTLAAAGRVVLEQLPPEGQAVYSPALHGAELRVAQRIDALLTTGQALDQAEFAIAEFERLSGLQLAGEQRAAVEQTARSKVLVITGGPGVGKTTIVQALLALFDASRMTVKLAAPTGRAAKRMSEATDRPASTIHRLLAFDPKVGKFGRNRENPIDAGAVIVDEASMIDLELADALLEAIPDEARLVLVGDVDQLPSVGPGAVLRDIIESGRVPCVRLSKIFRQAAGSSIVHNAHSIKLGVMPVGSTGRGAEFYIIQRHSPESARELITTLITERVPRGFGLDGRRDIQVLTPMQKGICGAVALNEMLQETLNPSGPEVKKGSRILRLGDKVMQLRNDYEKDVFNGDVGWVTEVNARERLLTVSFGDRDVPYDESDLDELSLAYATSIHKSQGSEYPAVIVPILTQHFVMLSRNLLYTAVTRGKRLVILISSPRALGIALAETRREDRRTCLAQRLAKLRSPVS